MTNLAKSRDHQMAEGHLQFVPLTMELVPACQQFKERLACSGAAGAASFGCDINPPRPDNAPAATQVERYVAIDAHGAVRGAYALRWQFLWLRGRRLLGAHYGFPVSEGVIDKRYAMVGVSVLRDAVKRCQYLYTLGADGRDGNVFGIGRFAGWAITDIPFLFRVTNGTRFLCNLPQVANKPHRRAIAAACGASGIARLAFTLLHHGRAISNHGSASLRLSSGIGVEETRDMAAPADEIWRRVRTQYDFCVVRDGGHVAAAFPDHHAVLHRLLVRKQGSLVGWAVVMMKNLSRLRAYLGDVAPGLIVDSFGDTAYAADVICAATAYLADHGVDVVITNTSHQAWVNEYGRAGFLRQASQFPLIVSRSLASEIGDLHTALPGIHMSRADGDGVHYLN